MAYTASTLGAAARCSKSTSFLPLMPTLAACSASLAHALQELWRARVWGCSLCLAGSDPFTISTMPGQESHRGAAQGPSKTRNLQMSQPGSPRAGPSQARSWLVPFGFTPRALAPSYAGSLRVATDGSVSRLPLACATGTVEKDLVASCEAVMVVVRA